MIFLGLDTSNYTTSVCAVDGDRVISRRRILEVSEGKRGLRQSDGVFMHMKNLPELYADICSVINPKDIKAIGVSTRPRSVEGSYMPVFLAGMGYAEVIGATLGIPVYSFSHQDGHIMAGIASCEAYELLKEEFVSVHISGGTTEILRSRFGKDGFENEIIGGTRDISAGQFIDRVGVALNMKFPAGIYMEEAALSTEDKVSLPVKTDGAWMNFSGVETKASRIAHCIVTDEDKAALARGVLTGIRRALIRAITAAMKETGLRRALIAGGVASNKIIREGLRSMPYSVKFASREFSSDNAMGTARLAQSAYGSTNRNSIAD